MLFTLSHHLHLYLPVHMEFLNIQSALVVSIVMLSRRWVVSFIWAETHNVAELGAAIGFLKCCFKSFPPLNCGLIVDAYLFISFCIYLSIYLTLLEFTLALYIIWNTA